MPAVSDFSLTGWSRAAVLHWTGPFFLCVKETLIYLSRGFFVDFKGEAIVAAVKKFITFLCSSLVASFAGRTRFCRRGRQTNICSRRRPVLSDRCYVFDSRQPGPWCCCRPGSMEMKRPESTPWKKSSRKIKVYSGKLIILPRMNPPAIQINRTVFQPGHESDFPRSALGFPL